MIPTDSYQTKIRYHLPLAGIKELMPVTGELACWNPILKAPQKASAFWPLGDAEKSFLGVCVERREKSVIIESGGFWRARWAGVPLKVGMPISFCIEHGMYSSTIIGWTGKKEGIGVVTSLIDHEFVEVQLKEVLVSLL